MGSRSSLSGSNKPRVAPLSRDRPDHLSPTEHFLHHRQHAVAGDPLPKEDLVLEFDTRHIEQILDAFLHAELLRKFRGVLVLDDIPVLEPPGEIHRHEPAGKVTGKPERPADGPEDALT